MSARVANAAAMVLMATFALVGRAQDPALRLEMLTERIAKLQAQLGQGLVPEHSRRALPEALREFDANLREVNARPAGADVRDNYLLLGLLWPEYRGWATRAPTRDNAKKLAERAEEMAWVAAKGVRLAAEGGRPAPARLASDAARAATLSQRLARLYLLQRWGVKPEGSTREIPEVTAELQLTFARLVEAGRGVPELQTELQAAEGQLAFLLKAGREIEGRRANPRALEFVVKAADHVLESMDRVARLSAGG